MRRLKPPHTPSSSPPTTTPTPQVDSSQPSCSAPPPKWRVTSSGSSEKAGVRMKLMAMATASTINRPGHFQT
jgi:hypothetical protein